MSEKDGGGKKWCEIRRLSTNLKKNINLFNIDLEGLTNLTHVELQ